MYKKNISLVIIGVYYGTFPDWLPYWLKSCADNPTIDFLIATDTHLQNIPENVYLINLSMKQFKALAEEKLEMEIAFERPYKACDLKPAYGKILSDYIVDYDYWGHCDFDLIWGDIRYFTEMYSIEKYDKFLPLGHLALYRNTEECNNYYKLPGSNCGTYQQVFSSSQGFAFDETDGIYSIYKKNNLPMFTGRIFAEIKTYHHRFRLKQCDRNYRQQVFYYENGKMYRAFVDKGQVKTEEYIYIHFRRKLLSESEKKWEKLDSFYIGPNGFQEKEPGIPELEDIKKYNHNPGVIYETLETLKFCLKNINKVKSKISNEIVARRM